VTHVSTPSDPTLKRRVGRPPHPASESRQRIIDAARAVFAERGFDVATNREIADAAGMTAAALYYHFDSKGELYRAVYEHAQAEIYREFGEATAGVNSFIGQLRAILWKAHELNRADPTLARFTAAVRVDSARHPEMFEALGSGGLMRRRFFEDLVVVGVRTGEVDAGDGPAMTMCLMAAVIGLNDSMSDDLDQHRLAIQGMLRVFERRDAD
jgi:AcrR family transcriptional regulator